MQVGCHGSRYEHHIGFQLRLENFAQVAAAVCVFMQRANMRKKEKSRYLFMREARIKSTVCLHTDRARQFFIFYYIFFFKEKRERENRLYVCVCACVCVCNIIIEK